MRSTPILHRRWNVSESGMAWVEKRIENRGGAASVKGARIEAWKAPRGLKRGVPLPSQLGGLRSVVSSLSGVRPATHVQAYFMATEP